MLKNGLLCKKSHQIIKLEFILQIDRMKLKPEHLVLLEISLFLVVFMKIQVNIKINNLSLIFLGSYLFL